MSRPDPVFRHYLERAHESETWVAWYLRSRGIPAKAMPQRIRPDGTPPGVFTDGGLDVLAYVRDPPVLVQVKRRNLEFTGPHDFPYATAFLDAADARFHSADWFVLVNEGSTAGVAFEAARLRGAWLRERRWDSVRGKFRTFISCPSSRGVSLEALALALAIIA